MLPIMERPHLGSILLCLSKFTAIVSKELRSWIVTSNTQTSTSGKKKPQMLRLWFRESLLRPINYFQHNGKVLSHDSRRETINFLPGFLGKCNKFREFGKAATEEKHFNLLQPALVFANSHETVSTPHFRCIFHPDVSLVWVACIFRCAIASVKNNSFTFFCFEILIQNLHFFIADLLQQSIRNLE